MKSYDPSRWQVEVSRADRLLRRVGRGGGWEGGGILFLHLLVWGTQETFARTSANAAPDAPLTQQTLIGILNSYE